MTRRLASPKVLLIADDRPAPLVSSGTAVRRYRLARLRLDGRTGEPAERYEHLKRIYD